MKSNIIVHGTKRAVRSVPISWGRVQTLVYLAPFCSWIGRPWMGVCEGVRTESGAAKQMRRQARCENSIILALDY